MEHKQDRYSGLFKLSKYEDFDVQFETIDGENRWHSKWEKFSEVCGNPKNFISDIIVHRKVLNQEIVFDFDAEYIEINKSCVYHLCYVLKQKQIKYYVYFSGGKGFHVHIYFDYSVHDYSTPTDLDMLSDSDKISCLRRNVIAQIFNGYKEAYAIIKPYMDDMIIDVYRKLIRAEGYLHHKGRHKSFISLDNPVDIFKWDLNQFSEDFCYYEIHDIEFNKISLIEPFKEKIALIKEEKKLRGERVYVESPYLRKKVYELLDKPLVDGRKQVLYLLVNEMRCKNWDINKTFNHIIKWNSLNHESKGLKMNLITSQINAIYDKDKRPLRNTTIDRYLENVTLL